MAFDIAVLVVGNTLVALAIGLGSRSKSFLALLFAYSLVLSLGGALSLGSSIPIEPGGVPNLAGSDGEGYFEEAVLLSREGIDNFRDLITTNYSGYQIFLALWFSVFGPSLAVGLVANNLLLLLSVLVLYRATVLLTSSRQAGLLACLALMLTPSHIYHSLLLLKEPAIGLAFSLMLLSLTEALKGRGLGLRPVLLFLAGIAIVMALRGTLLLFVIVLLGYLATLFLKRKSHVLVMLAALLLLLAPLAQVFTTHTLDTEFIAETITLNTIISATLDGGEVDAGGVVGRVSGAYLELPFTAKLALFFIPSLLQILLPFDFWSTAFIDQHFSAFFARNLNPIWYLFVAAWALFSLVNSRRINEPLLRRFLLAGATFYVMIAVIYGGAIPRYAAPALFFVYPAIGYWWDRFRLEPQVRTRVKVFFRRYFASILILLLPYLALSLLRLI